jgi:hypothetical protein
MSCPKATPALLAHGGRLGVVRGVVAQHDDVELLEVDPLLDVRLLDVGQMALQRPIALAVGRAGGRRE